MNGNAQDTTYKLMNMKKVVVKLSDLYLHSTIDPHNNAYKDPYNDPYNYPSNEIDGHRRDDSGTRVRLGDDHSFITKMVVELRPIDDIKCRMGGVDLSYVRNFFILRIA